METYTTRFALFAKCLGHSAKALPSAAYSIYHTATKDSAKRSLPSAIFRALRKALPSVELALGKKKDTMTVRKQ